MSQVQLSDKLVGVLVSTQQQVPAAQVLRRTTVVMPQTLRACTKKFWHSKSDIEQLSCSGFRLSFRFIDRVVYKVLT